MFDAVVVRRTTIVGSDYQLDLGRLAETMLFYGTVHLALTYSSVYELLRQCGPDIAIEIVANSNVNAVYVDRYLAVKSDGLGTADVRYQPVTMTILGDKQVQTPYDAVVVKLFQDALGKDGKGRRMARRFLEHVHPHEISKDILAAVVKD